MIHLRPYQAADLAALYELDQICFPAGIAYSRAELRYFLHRPGCFCCVGEDDASPASRTTPSIVCFLIAQLTLLEGRLAGYIVTLDVAPAQRRLGLGSRMLQAAGEWAKREGAVLMRLEVAVNNDDARQFYRSLGFLPVGKIKGYYGGKIDAEVLERVL